MDKLQQALAEVEDKMSDTSLYDDDRKDELNEAIQQQATIKTELEEAEMIWLSAQEAYDEKSEQLTEQLNSGELI